MFWDCKWEIGCWSIWCWNWCSDIWWWTGDCNDEGDENGVLCRTMFERNCDATTGFTCEFWSNCWPKFCNGCGCIIGGRVRVCGWTNCWEINCDFNCDKAAVSGTGVVCTRIGNLLLFKLGEITGRFIKGNFFSNFSSSVVFLR